MSEDTARRSFAGAAPDRLLLATKALPIGEARKRLPGLVRRVAQGGALAVERRPLRGLVLKHEAVNRLGDWPAEGGQGLAGPRSV